MRTMREYLVNLIIHGHWTVFSMRTMRRYLVNLIYMVIACFQCGYLLTFTLRRNLLWEESCWRKIEDKVTPGESKLA